ncbi:MAG: hypothetical protein AAF639_14315 [Chloroflexota bacterium]
MVKQKRYFFLRIGAIIAAFVFLMVTVVQFSGFSHSLASVPMQTINNQNYIRNGDFSQGTTGWFINATGSGVQNGYLEFQSLLEQTGTVAQQMHLPDTITVANFSFDYRVVQVGTATPGAIVRLTVQAVSDQAGLAFLGQGDFQGNQDWLTFSGEVDAAGLNAIQTTHTAGERIFLSFFMEQTVGASYRIDIDNISFTVNGANTIPAIDGTIGFVGLDANGNAGTVQRIQPDGSNQRLLWTHPSTIFPNIYDVAWNPNASELAFSSDHESLYSAFQSDIYVIQPDGSNLRRITNPPHHEGWPHGGATGSVTGRIYNSYGSSVAPFLLYVEGAQEAQTISMPGFEGEVDFAVDNVIDLGPGVLQYVAFTWSGGVTNSCTNGREYAVAIVDVVAGQTVDAGNITFNGYCNKYDVSSLSWNGDGSEVGFSVGGVVHRANATGESIGRSLIDFGLPIFDLAWSPVNDQILYTYNSNIYMTTAGAGEGTQLNLSINGGTLANPAWLPDGSGFVGVVDQTSIVHYDINTQETTYIAAFYNETVNEVSLSPDGRYIVFERVNANFTSRNLWILDRTQPTKMWPLTTNGVSTNPDWSRANPQNSQPPAQPTAVPNTSVSEPDLSNLTNRIYLPAILR